jgi:hypothetical protein
MKRLALLLIAAFTPSIAAFSAAAETIELGKGTARAEVGVKKGERFTLRLMGKGWYLREYDSSVLGFVSRATAGGAGEISAGRTEFVFNPFRKGTGHLLFTGPAAETYVLVRVGSEDALDGPGVESEEQAPLPMLSAAQEPSPEPLPPSAPKAEPSIEEPAVPLAEPAPAPDFTPGSVPGVPEVPEPEQPAGPGEPSKPKGTKPKQGEAVQKRSEPRKEEPDIGMYYTDKQNRIVEVQYKNEEDSYRRGSQFYQKAQNDKALDEYLKYLSECEKCSHMEEVHYRVAELYVKQGKDGEALGHLDTLLRASSRDLRLKAYLLRADIDLRSGNVKRAIEGYSAAWNIDARNKELPRKIADLYYAARDFDSALPLYEKSIENGSADDEVYFRAASIYDSEGRARNLEKAYKYYKTLVERFKGSDHSEYARKRVQFLEKNFYNFK